MKQLINNITADVIGCLYGDIHIYKYIYKIQAKYYVYKIKLYQVNFRRELELETIPKGSTNWSQRRTEMSQRWDDKLNRPQKGSQKGDQ